MSERIEVFELIERLDAASRDETLSDGMLYRTAAERLAEYISRDVKYWHKIMQRTDKQADRIRELEDRLQLQVIRYAELEAERDEGYEAGWHKLRNERDALREKVEELEAENERLREERLAFATHNAELEGKS